MSGSYVATLRKNKGLSQEALAEACGLSLRAVQRIEAGETSPRPHTINVLAKALDVPVEALAEKFNTPSTNAVLDSSILPALRVINFSTMLGLIIPFANVFVPMFLVRRNENLKKNMAYKKIISFQAIWLLVTLLAVVFTPVIIKLFTQTVAFGKLPPPILLTYGAMVLLNVFFTIRSAIQLRLGTAIYGWVPLIF